MVMGNTGSPQVRHFRGKALLRHMTEDRNAGLAGDFLRQGCALADLRRCGFTAQMGVIDEAGTGKAGGLLNGSKIRQRIVRLAHLRPVGVEDADQLVILLNDLGLEPGQDPGTHGVTADIQHAPYLPVFQDGQQLRRQGRHVGVRTGLRGGNHPYAGRLQHRTALPGAKVGVHDVQVRQHHGAALGSQRQGQIHRQLRLAGAVVSGNNRDAVGKHARSGQIKLTSQKIPRKFH